MTKHKIASFIFFHCGLPLLVGAFSYVFFNPTYFKKAPKLLIQPPWLKQVLFTLPDFCWSYSFATALYLFSIVYQYKRNRSALFIFVLIAGSEVIQLVMPRYFTFDIFDLLAAVLAFGMSTWQTKNIAYEKNG